MYYPIEALCGKTSCNYHAKCIALSNGETECVCPMCFKNYEPVCGSDGHSYANQCFMERNSCILKKHIEVIKQGVCGTLIVTRIFDKF